jgi:hypothetical protein
MLEGSSDAIKLENPQLNPIPGVPVENVLSKVA